MSPPITPESPTVASAMSTPSNDKKTASAASSSTSASSAMFSPGRGNNNNYAAPNTPIASAKRPRNAASKKQINHAVIHEHETTNDISIANASSANANANATGATDTDTDTDTDISLAGVLTPVRKMKLDSPVANSNSRIPMSPMHPMRPVTEHDKNDKPYAKTNAITVGADAAPDDSSPPSSTSVLKSIFSPVLNFLNQSHSNKDNDHIDVISDDDITKAHTNANTNTDTNANANANANTDTKTKADTNVHTQTIDQAQDRNDTAESRMHSHTATDKDGDVNMQGYQKATANMNTNTNTVTANHTYIHSHDQSHTTPRSNEVEYDYGHYAHTPTTSPSVDTDNVHDDTTKNGHAQAQTHSETNADVSADVSTEDNGQDDEDEFNPYVFIKYLPPYQAVVPNPQRKICLPPKNHADPKISLVLDLDETLVHCTVEPIPDADMTFPVLFNGVEYKVHVRTRPFLMDFLEAIHDKFEVVVFTASQEVYASELLNRIDPDGKYIKHRMYRESCLLVEGNYLKDLNVLGRDLSQAVLVDNSPHAFGYQVDNGIPIESWFDDPNDTELLKLEQFCSTLHGVKDVRTMVRSTFQTYKLIRHA